MTMRLEFLTSVLVIVAAALATEALPAQSEETLTQRLSAAAERIQKESRIPAMAFSVHQRGRLYHQDAIGVVDLEHGAKAKAGDWYRIGAVTMPITAAAVLTLQEDGHLTLQDPIADHLPKVPEAWAGIRVLDLLQHTSGIPNFTSTEQWHDQIRNDLSPDDLWEILLHEKCEFPPRTKYAFNPSGYYLLGLIIESKSKETFARYLRDRVLGSVAKRDIIYDDQRRILRGRVRGYEVVSGRRRHADFISMKAPFAAAGLLARVSGLSAWMDALAAEKVLSAESLAQLTKPVVLEDGTPVDYACGLAIGRVGGSPIWAHQGFIAGFSAQLLHLPEYGVSIAVAANTSSQLVGRLAVELARSCRHELPRYLAPLMGTWQAGDTRFRLQGTEEVLEVVFDGQESIPLRRTSNDRFEGPEGKGIVLEVTADLPYGTALQLDRGKGPAAATRPDS